MDNRIYMSTRKSMTVQLLLPQHVEELLYDLDCCLCDLEWCCVPHNACFIHDSCFCKGSGSFPPVKPQRPTWAQFLYDWYCELAASLTLHPIPCSLALGQRLSPTSLSSAYPIPIPSSIVSVLTRSLVDDGYCSYLLYCLPGRYCLPVC